MGDRNAKREARELLCDSTWGCCHGEHYGLCVLRGSGGEDAVIRVAAALAERDRTIASLRAEWEHLGREVAELRAAVADKSETIRILRSAKSSAEEESSRLRRVNEELRARCAELEADRERLDYLVHVGSDGVRQGENANWSVGREDWTWVESDNLRAAIDAARRQEPDDADR